MTDICARCDEIVTFFDTADDGTPMYSDDNGMLICGEYHGHDEEGAFAPKHDPDEARVQRDNATYFVVYDGTDACHFDDDLDDWIVPDNPFTEATA